MTELALRRLFQTRPAALTQAAVLIRQQRLFLNSSVKNKIQRI